MGLRDFLVGRHRPAGEVERTVPLASINSYAQMDAFAHDAAHRVSTGDPEIRKAARYCLIELIRNVFDHSGTRPVVCAQFMRAGRGGRSTDAVQIAVSDAGIGLLATLQEMHEWVQTDSMAVDAAITPYVSRTFPMEGYSHMHDNAGLGLYFVAELVKRSDGRLLIWSGDHLRLLVGDSEASDGHSHLSARTDPIPRTTVVFEFQVGLIDNYDEFFCFLREQTWARTPSPHAASE